MNAYYVFRRKWETTRKTYFNKQATFRMHLGSRTNSSPNWHLAWQAGQVLRSSLYIEGAELSTGRKVGESELTLHSGCGWNAGAVLTWSKCAYSRDRKDRTKAEPERISFPLLQAGSGKVMARRTFQQHGCEQDDISSTQSSWLIGTGDQGSTVFWRPRAEWWGLRGICECSGTDLQ